jgi:AraC family transcriptional regulator
MTAQKWVRFEGAGGEQFTVRASSEGHGWTGFNAALYESGPGRVEVPYAPCHNLTMHVSAPIDVTCRCDGPAQRRLQTSGDMDLVPAGCGVMWEDAGPNTVLSITLSPLILRSTAESMGVDVDAISLSPMLQLRDPMLQHIAWAVKAELETGEPNDRLYAESLGTALTVRLLRRYAKRSAPQRGLTKRQWRAVVDYINADLAQSHSLMKLAAVAGVGTSTFKVLFKQSFGVSVHQYVIKRRVEHAMNLLSSGRVKLNDIAQKAGFVDQSHMGRCFRRLIGMTPGAVAREYRGAEV